MSFMLFMVKAVSGMEPKAITRFAPPHRRAGDGLATGWRPLCTDPSFVESESVEDCARYEPTIMGGVPSLTPLSRIYKNAICCTGVRYAVALGGRGRQVGDP